MSEIMARVESNIKGEESNVKKKTKYVKECASEGSYSSQQQQSISHHALFVIDRTTFKYSGRPVDNSTPFNTRLEKIWQWTTPHPQYSTPPAPYSDTMGPNSIDVANTITRIFHKLPLPRILKIFLKYFLLKMFIQTLPLLDYSTHIQPNMYDHGSSDCGMGCLTQTHDYLLILLTHTWQMRHSGEIGLVTP